jgi:precorrin-6x reductase
VKVLVCGSRTWRDNGRVFTRLEQLPEGTLVIHGAASSGADHIADWVIRRHLKHLKLKRFPANWRPNGVFDRAAGFKRNVEMLDERPDLVVAFWDGKSGGTKHTIDEARKRGIPVEIVERPDLSQLSVDELFARLDET